jgi:hypothetical protein
MSTTIPTMTKEEIWSDPEINAILETRDITEAYFDDTLLPIWLNLAVGMVTGAIIETYSQYIDTNTWKYIMTEYCKSVCLEMNYSTELQNSGAVARGNLQVYIMNLRDNIMAQASLKVIVNKQPSFRTYNKVT